MGHDSHLAVCCSVVGTTPQPVTFRRLACIDGSFIIYAELLKLVSPFYLDLTYEQHFGSGGFTAPVGRVTKRWKEESLLALPTLYKYYIKNLEKFQIFKGERLSHLRYQSVLYA